MVPTGLQVLVVDETRSLMTRMLVRLGCKVSTAENGEIALEMVLGDCIGRFAVVFLDNQMPVMTGLSMVAKLREAGRSDFVVGVTGNALLSDQEEYLETGLDKCVHLPVIHHARVRHTSTYQHYPTIELPAPRQPVTTHAVSYSILSPTIPSRTAIRTYTPSPAISWAGRTTSVTTP